jgi:GTP-binding protein EngB required for normal cell division
MDLSDLSSFKDLQSVRQLKLLDEIDALRTYGLQEYVSLPQLVVCGDQSAGKSSVLEAITEIPFPRKDNLCTRFATEIVLRRSGTDSLAVSIKPSKDRSSDDAERLKKLHLALENFEGLPLLIDQATEAMGLGTFSHRAFSKDVLSIEISGPSKPHLTIVDLPGLVHSPTGDQTQDDIDVVNQLVNSYLENQRTIMLVVVTAKNDYALQEILKRARNVDPNGQRTLGIVTKPDTLKRGSEAELSFVTLAQNGDSSVRFKLGWHVLVNRDFDTKDSSFDERNTAEAKFFNQGNWAKLPPDNLGIDTLRSRLSKLLFNHIRQELPAVASEIEAALIKSKAELERMGKGRTSLKDQSIFLIKLSQEFMSICKSGVDGSCEGPFFGDISNGSGYERRLRALIQNRNAMFESKMRLRGHTREILTSASDADGSDEAELTETTPARNVANEATSDAAGPAIVTEDEAVEWVMEVRWHCRGRELSGTSDPMMINVLFHEQSKRWETEASRHLVECWSACCQFVQSIIQNIAQETVSKKLQSHWIDKQMNDKLQAAQSELQRLIEDLQDHAITYNHYFTDNIQHENQKELEPYVESGIRDVLDLSDTEDFNVDRQVTFKPSDMAAKITSLLEVNMDRFACLELLKRMRAYYKVG